MDLFSSSSKIDTAFKKKLIQVIACPCHQEEITARGKKQIVKKHRHFHCQCNVRHETFVATCQGDPTIYLLLDDMVQNCFCKKNMRDIGYLKNVCVDFFFKKRKINF